MFAKKYVDLTEACSDKIGFIWAKYWIADYVTAHQMFLCFSCYVVALGEKEC